MTDTITIPLATVQQALEALHYGKANKAVTILRKALEQPVQEPVAYDKTEMNSFVIDLYEEKMREGKHGHYETLFHCVHQAIKRAAHNIKENT